jgi:hypothetical protein
MPYATVRISLTVITGKTDVVIVVIFFAAVNIGFGMT